MDVFEQKLELLKICICFSALCSLWVLQGLSDARGVVIPTPCLLRVALEGLPKIWLVTSLSGRPRRCHKPLSGPRTLRTAGGAAAERRSRRQVPASALQPDLKRRHSGSSSGGSPPLSILRTARRTARALSLRVHAGRSPRRLNGEEASSAAALGRGDAVPSAHRFVFALGTRDVSKYLITWAPRLRGFCEGTSSDFSACRKGTCGRMRPSRLLPGPLRASGRRAGRAGTARRGLVREPRTGAAGHWGPGRFLTQERTPGTGVAPTLMMSPGG